MRKFLIVQLVTIMRIPLVLLFAAILLFFERSIPILSLCAIILVVAELTDLFDGMLARRFNIISEWGAMLDPYSDSISRLIVYWALAYSALVNPLTPLAMAVRDITVAYCRIIMTKNEVSVSAKWSGKIKAGFQSIGAYVILMGPVYWQWTGTWTIEAASWIIIIVTLGSMFEYIKSAAFAARRSEKS